MLNESRLSSASALINLRWPWSRAKPSSLSLADLHSGTPARRGNARRRSIFWDMCRRHLCGVEAGDGPRIAGGLCRAQHRFSTFSMYSQRPQEADDARVLAPLSCVLPIRDIAMSQGFGLHFQINLRIDMRGVQRDVSQPTADGIDVDACTQQMDGTCVPHGVRTDSFLFEGRHFCARLDQRPLHEVIDAKPGERLTKAVQKHSFMRGTATHQGFEHLGSVRPQWAASSLVAFTLQTDGTERTPGEIPHRGMRGFVDSCTGVVEEQQHCVVARALFGASIRRSQYRIHLRFVEVGHCGFGGLPEG